MPSNINPFNIDGQFPIAGQDNDSQGFRDNFTNIRNNLVFAKSEIEDLQHKVILKAPLSGNNSVTNDFNGTVLSNASIKQFNEITKNFGPISGDVTISYHNGHFQKVVTDSEIRLVFLNTWPAAGVYAKLRLLINVTNHTTHTIQFPSEVTVDSLLSIAGVSNTSSGYVLTVPANGEYLFEFSTSDGGGTIIVSEVTRKLIPNPNVPSESVSSGAISTSIKTTYFVTTGATTSTLAAGNEGQQKLLVMHTYGGNMVVTVSNAGWKATGSGTITFNAIGDTCHLQFINGKWFVIGSNSITLA